MMMHAAQITGYHRNKCNSDPKARLAFFQDFLFPLNTILCTYIKILDPFHFPIILEKGSYLIWFDYKLVKFQCVCSSLLAICIFLLIKRWTLKEFGIHDIVNNNLVVSLTTLNVVMALLNSIYYIFLFFYPVKSYPFITSWHASMRKQKYVWA